MPRCGALGPAEAALRRLAGTHLEQTSAADPRRSWPCGGWRRVSAARTRARDAPEAAPEQMVNCSHCGLYLPQSEAIADGDKYYLLRRAPPPGGLADADNGHLATSPPDTQPDSFWVSLRYLQHLPAAARRGVPRRGPDLRRQPQFRQPQPRAVQVCQRRLSAAGDRVPGVAGEDAQLFQFPAEPARHHRHRRDGAADERERRIQERPRRDAADFACGGGAGEPRRADAVLCRARFHRDLAGADVLDPESSITARPITCSRGCSRSAISPRR